LEALRYGVLGSGIASAVLALLVPPA